MLRMIDFRLNQVSPTPSSLRADPQKDAPGDSVSINLGQLFMHYYFDSYPEGAPNPDPTRFEYAELVSATADFRFHDYVGHASTVKKRNISTELGQAFCRLLLSEHFGITYFAHMNTVLDKQTHAAFDGLCIKRKQKGDVPDYLCARNVTEPMIAEAKGRFSAIDFNTTEFAGWRQQFERISVVTRTRSVLKTKGFVVGTRFATTAQRATTRTASYIEDPETDGESAPHGDQARALGRVTMAVHYARILRKLDLISLAAALEGGFSVPSELQFVVPVWRCMLPPMAGVNFVGGIYITRPGAMPTLTNEGWRIPAELGRGHAAFVGLQLPIVKSVTRAARGAWDALDDVSLQPPDGPWSSEFSWLRDGSVIAPITYFIPMGTVTL